MEIAVSSQGGATVVRISGNLDGNTVNVAQEKIMPLVGAKGAGVVLDLKDCGYISSAGLRLLLMAAKQVAAQDGALVLSGVSPEVRDVMEMTGFNNFFRMFDAVPAAVAAVKKGA